MAGKPKDITGLKFGRLTAIRIIGRSESTRGVIWECLCDCGKTTQAIGTLIRSGHTKSCGCFFKDSRKTCARTHGGCMDGRSEPEYGCHQGMMKRCYNKNHKSYPRYGGIGVFVDPSLHDYLAFKAYIGPRPSLDHSIDRFPEKDGNYVPGNIRWATRREQQQNLKTNRLLTFNGETLPMIVWTRRKGWKPSKLKCRKAAGWSDERALTEP